MGKAAAWVAVWGIGASLWACGSPAVEEPAPAQAAAGDEAREPTDDLNVEGLRGTLSPSEVQMALEPRMLKFAVCPSKSSDVEFIWGEMGFHFTVGADGRVTDVYGTRSSLGDRKTEACMLDVARKARFPRPRGGGNAEFNWSLEIPPSEDVRAPVELGPDVAEAALAESAGPLLESCGEGPYAVTAYVETDGTVLAAGVIVPQPGAEEALDCVAAGLQDWQLTSPGSYPGKLSFTLQ